MLFLRAPSPEDRSEVLSAYERSRDLHQPWTFAPQDVDEYLHQEHRYLLCLSETGAIVGSFHLSGIIRGCFHSAYLAYEVFAPYQEKGLMAAGMRLLLKEAFETLNLHRLEANIQPGNTASIRLVAKSGFVKEGFSLQYLRIGDEWRDHERWAIINPTWRG
jgi:ribosomal-protein-alanine N-acetyltransferase